MNGGVRREGFNGSRAILSGPAGGVVGYAMTTYHKETTLPIIGFDMGGTSTDVSRYGGCYEHVYESTTAGITIQAAQLDINTVAAGGGSMLFFRSGLFEVGPESAGAHPGPACYKKGGPLTVTDANLVLGRLLPEYFPKIFGPNENESLDVTKTLWEFEKLTHQVNEHMKLNNETKITRMSVEEVAMGLIKVANETMCRPIRALTQAKGYNTAMHVLACFGGAGGQHACAIARSLGMGTVFVHKYAGILSAYGMALADVVEEAQEPCADIYEPGSFERFKNRFDILSNEVRDKLNKQGFTDDKITLEYYLHMRYDGTDCALMCLKSDGKNIQEEISGYGNFSETFLERYKIEFGFIMPGRRIFVNDIRVRGIGKSKIFKELILPRVNNLPRVEKVTRVYFDGGYQETNVYQMNDLCHGHNIYGPAIIMDSLSTIIVEPNCSAFITEFGDVRITIGEGARTEITMELDAIHLSIFSHRFMSIAEQMGRILQRTSISTNIKERLDFSCAVFGPDGGLVSNAPHIPVHLGAMQETVQYQMKAFRGEFTRGDVILANHPSAGGSHLPDLTVITPVFYSDQPKPVFFVACRGHHADIGGITPGSMPPHSTSLNQEGATFKSFLLVHKGIFREKEVTEALMAPGKIPGSSGTRNLSDNLSDLKAQIAANHKVDGTGYEVWGNCNAPRAVTLSAIIYCLRCIVGRDGCLKPVKIIIPKGSLLDPSEEAAVVGGNVLTSQRVVDVVLAAFGACAASQGCMNNITLGTETWGYYETVAGGSGAGPTWDGRSGIHTHMTNTRITDPEILELRYPVILECFSLRNGSGGSGVYRGGDGVTRRMKFRGPMTLSILTERRSHSPPGIEGGSSGARGRNTLIKNNGKCINLGPKTAVPISPGVVQKSNFQVSLGIRYDFLGREKLVLEIF
ncbi:hypothetical protein PV327_010349 [Microctonus hyperodae]|uniref:5-oxoprolinase n=1 Tax=Microctonus hyperodae TaxID=165561 RepID=A0AA39FS31_MICHY|nr:hypothetical protein PV327_010349 [Microctonus hyperodae]